MRAIGPPEMRSPGGKPGQRKMSSEWATDDIYSRAAPPSSASLRQAGFELRPYQREAVEAIIKGFVRRQRVVAPTGSGKTLLFARVAEHYQPLRTLVLAHREELLEQARDKILKATGIVAGIEAAERYASLDAPIVIASIPSLHEQRRRRFSPDHFALIVVDEAHHALAESWQRVLGYFEDARVLGVTATPDRGDKRLLGDYFENVAAETTLIDLIRDGYLARVRVKTIPLQIDIRGVHSVAGDYSADELGHAIEPYLEQIADVIAADYATRKTLCFLPLCPLSERFAFLCRERGIAAEHVQGTSPDRPDVIQRLRTGETTLVSNAMLLTEGFDEPSIDCIIPLRPTKIRSLYAQQIGRGTRLHPGKDHLQVLDFLWITHRHDLIRPPVLIAKDEEEAKALGGDGDLLDRAEKYRQKKFARLAEALEANKRRQGKEFDLIEFAVALGDEDIAHFEPVMRWHGDQITPRQSEFLTRCGINPATLKSKGHACHVIDRIMQRRAAGLATFKQVRALRKFGVPDSHLISFTRAHAILDCLLGKRLGRGTSA
jgi:superfamily II DNA or RNA helicase